MREICVISILSLWRLTTCFKHLFRWKVSFKKNMVLRHWEISVLCIIQECDNIATLKSNFYSIICQVVPYGRLKMKENLKLLDLKVVTVSNGRWFLPRGFKYSDLTWKLLVFWRSSRLLEVVTTGGLAVLKKGNVKVWTMNIDAVPWTDNVDYQCYFCDSLHLI